MMTEAGDIDTGCFSRFHDSLTGPCPNVTSIYFYIDYFIH
jgi:hypothetical protein